MELTPNVKTLLIGGTADKPPSLNLRAIVKHLETLENLGWHIYGYSKIDFQVDCVLDSIITGISPTFCRMMSRGFRNVEELSQDEVGSYERLRQNVSILKLKGRRNKIYRPFLQISFFFCIDGWLKPKIYFFSALKRFHMSVVLRRNAYSDGSGDKFEDSDLEYSSDDEDNRDSVGFGPESYLYHKCLTKVSKLLAFDLMPGLDVNIIDRYAHVH